MALTDNRTRLQDCQDDADFATTGSQLNPNDLAGNTLISPNSVQVQHSNVYDDTYAIEDSADATFALDLSNSTIYIAVKDNGYDVAEVVGAGVVVGDTGGTDRIGYQAGGSNALGLPYQKVFNVFKIDLSETDANPGSSDVGHHVFNGAEANFDSSDVTQIGYGGIHNAKAQGNVANVFISGIYYDLNTDYHASVTGGSSGTPETMTDLVGDDETVGAAMFSNPIGDAFYLFANTEFGAATGDTGFEGVDQQWYYVGDNGGGRSIGAGNFIFRLLGGTGTNAFRQTRVVNINTGVRAPFDMSDADFDELELLATTWINFGAITYPVQDASKFSRNSTYVNGDQMDLSSLDMDGNTWNGSNDANGAVVWGTVEEDQEKQINSTFVRSGTHNAIEIAPVGAGPFTYDVSGLVVDGFASQDDGDAVEAEKVFFINPSTLDADININLAGSSAVNIGGGLDTGIEGFSYRIVGSYTGLVTITQTVTLAITVTDADDGSVLEDVFVSIRNAATNALVSEGRTNASGLYQDTGYNYTGDLAVKINVRKSSPGDTRYLPKADGNTIISTGMNAAVQMTPDPIAGAIDAVRFDISKHGQISNDVSGTTITAKVKLPGGTNRKLVVAGFYWDSTVNRTVTSFTFDGDAMTDTAGGNFVQEGSEFHEVFLYRHDIPDADSGAKDVVLTLSGAAPFRAIAFAVINKAAAGAEEDDGNSVGQAVTSNPSISLNNTTQPAIDVMFSLTDDLDTFPPAASGVGSIRRADKVVDGAKQITIIRADRVATGAHSIGADYDASSKSYVSAAATFGD